jgi:hypothetical protein
MSLTSYQAAPPRALKIAMLTILRKLKREFEREPNSQTFA